MQLKEVNSDTTIAWLGQFCAEDQSAVIELLRAIKIISRDAFAEGLRTSILHHTKAGELPVGLYAEREVSQRRGVPHRLFKESKTKKKRAHGIGPAPVKSIRGYHHDVGSEGIVAQLISELCREYPKRFLNHPGPDEIRKSKVRKFALVTDFIGSGFRARNYLNAAWRVRSVRSWWSARKTCGLRFEIYTYASTELGKKRVEAHPSAPVVYEVRSCPTSWNTFTDPLLQKIKSICCKYCPQSAHSISPFGFDSAGTLIAFSHGIPNNAPAILHKSSSAWAPLFPARLATAFRVGSAGTKPHFDVSERLLRMRQKKLAGAPELKKLSEAAREFILVLSAISRPPRTDQCISRRTDLTVLEIRNFISKALDFGWIDVKRHLTDSGHAQLAHLRKSKHQVQALPKPSDEFYYPSALRAPRELSS